MVAPLFEVFLLRECYGDLIHNILQDPFKNRVSTLYRAISLNELIYDLFGPVCILEPCCHFYLCQNCENCIHSEFYVYEI